MEYHADESGPGTGEPESSGAEAEVRQLAGQPLTGEPRVDAALARLDELPDLPVSEHREVFEHVHRRLTDVLGELDAGPPDTGDVTGNSGTSYGAGRSG
jgi:hypothetical protein